MEYFGSSWVPKPKLLDRWIGIMSRWTIKEFSYIWILLKLTFRSCKRRNIYLKVLRCRMSSQTDNQVSSIRSIAMPQIQKWTWYVNRLSKSVCFELSFSHFCTLILLFVVGREFRNRFITSLFNIFLLYCEDGGITKIINFFDVTLCNGSFIKNFFLVVQNFFIH